MSIRKSSRVGARRVLTPDGFASTDSAPLREVLCHVAARKGAILFWRRDYARIHMSNKSKNLTSQNFQPRAHQGYYLRRVAEYGGRNAMRLVELGVAACFSLVVSASLRAQEVPGCGVLQNAYGPFDYRDPVNKRDNLPIVETFHFTPEVEALQHGTSGSVLGDLKYTLRAFPNHHRALSAVARYAIAGGQIPIDDSIPSVECYFLRAVAFRPEDETVHVIYANYLKKTGEREKAREEYEEALRLAPESVEINYVAGLFFVDAGDLDRAKKLAKIAYAGGYPLPGLKKKIAAAEAAVSKESK